MYDMEIQAEKLQLIQWLAGLTDVETLRQLIRLKQSKETDWWKEIDEEEKAEIEKGLAEADKGDFVPHSEVMQRYRQWL